MTAERHENLDERLLHRMLFFTDAVFAIVMTLLVLELRPPGGLTAAAQAQALVDLLPRLFAFALSFTIVGVFWLAHLSTTRLLARFDWKVAMANLVFLLPVCLVPFVSAWLGEGLGTRVAWAAYAVVMIAVSLGNVAIVLVSRRGGGRLMTTPCTLGDSLYFASRAATPALAFAIGLILLAFNQVRYAQFCWVLIPIILWTRDRIRNRTSKAPAETA